MRSRTRSGRSSGCGRGCSPRSRRGRRRGPALSGMWPYGDSPSRIRSPPITPAKPTSMTPSRSLQVEPDPEAAEEDRGAGEHPHGPGERRVEATAAKPDPAGAHEQVGERERPERCAHEDVTAVEEEQREAEREQRQQVEGVPRQMRRTSTSPRKKTALSGIHTHQAFSTLPPKDPTRPRAMLHATCGPVRACETRPSPSSTVPWAISPARPDHTLTVQRRVALSKVASVCGFGG